MSTQSPIPLFKVFMSEDVIEPVSATLRSGHITQGTIVDRFEDDLKKFFSFPYILTINSATSGLTMAIRMIKDDLVSTTPTTTTEVLTCPLTCMATNLPILANNLQIKWVDADINTCNINLKDLESKITINTKVIIIVHWGGCPVDLDELIAILDRTNKKFGFTPAVVEDCAHAFGAFYKSIPIGTNYKNLNSIKVFSLQAIKHLTTADGGLIMLPNEELYNRAKLLRWYGIDRDKRNFNKTDLRLENDVIDWGYKYHMNDLNATIGLHNLPHMENLLEKNKANAKFLHHSLTALEKKYSLIATFKQNDNNESANWLYTLRIKKNRDEFITYMKEHGIICSQVHKRNDSNTCFEEFKTELPGVDILEREMVCIPVGWWLTEADRIYIIDFINNFCCSL